MKLDVEVVTSSSLPPNILREVYADLDWKEMQFQIAQAVEEVIHESMLRRSARLRLSPVKVDAVWVSQHNVKITKK